MKTINLTLSVFLFFCCSFSINAQTYVKADATGNNDGTSWADAYTTLHDALENYSADDEIWVTAGTYLPQMPSAWTGAAKNTFYIYQNVKLYGGFNGTETELSERDPVANLTILSGDLNGDDDETDIMANRSDNVINVVYVESPVDTNTVIDGFTIMGGHAAGDASVPWNQRGGGLWTLGAPQVRNCHFLLNYAFTFGGGLYVREVNSGGTIVDDCLFKDNLAERNGGGMIVYTFNAPEPVTINNCLFDSNESNIAGGGFYGSLTEIYINNTQFIKNSTVGTGGGAFVHTNNSNNTEVFFTDCEFLDNTSERGGGFGFNATGGQNNSNYFNSCIFTGNEAVYGGGLFFQYGEGANTNGIQSIVDCLIEDNSSSLDGGGITLFNGVGSTNHLQISDCQIIENTAGGEGGGIVLYELGATAVSASISKTHFSGNSANLIQGFATIYDQTTAEPSSRDISLVNCLFTDHNTDDLSTSVVSAVNSEFKLSSCTLSGNNCLSTNLEGDGIMTIENTILNNANYPNFLSNTPTTVEIISLGGNLFSDDALGVWADILDQSSTDPLFESGSYQLSESSPGVDGGQIPAELPDVDLAGNDRVQGGCIDVGAYESSYDSGSSCATSVRELIVDPSFILLSPNPVAATTNITIENDWKGTLQLRVVNTLGQEVFYTEFEKSEQPLIYELDMGALPKSTYRILVSNGEAMAVASLVKL